MDARPSTSKAGTSPQNEFIDAINFSEKSQIQDDLADNDTTTSKFKSMVQNVMKNVNDSKFIYPFSAILVASILVIILLFQKATMFSKVIAVLLLIIFTIFTVYQAKA